MSKRIIIYLSLLGTQNKFPVFVIVPSYLCLDKETIDRPIIHQTKGSNNLLFPGFTPLKFPDKKYKFKIVDNICTLGCPKKMKIL